MPYGTCIFENRSYYTAIMVTKSCWSIPALFNWYSMYTLSPAFATIFSTCLFQVRSLEIVAPKSLAYCTLSISFPSIINRGTLFLNSGSYIKLISISFDLSELICMSLCRVHLAAMSTECCRTESLFLWHISNSVLSSTCLYNGTGVSISSMYTRKHLDPSNVTCVTPPLGCPGGEYLFPILTCWVLSNRKVAIHLRISGGKSYCFNCTSSVLWLIRS